jgi:parvulin-like peptidyl-prolyl isomerase
MSVLAGGLVHGGSAERRYELKQQALGFLISSDWTIGEAAAQGIQISAREVAQRVAAKKRAAFPSGEAEADEFEHATGQSVADTSFEARAELAASKLHEAIVRREPAITPAQIASYYAHHRQLFVNPEQRQLLITNRKSPAAVVAIKKEVNAGRSFAAISQSDSVVRPDKQGGSGEVTALERAIYSAKANVLTGPIRKRVDYFVFEVLRITPRFQRTLAQVRTTIAQRLEGERARRVIAEFTKAWQSRWTAKTDCAPDYIVYQCKQYAGARSHGVQLGPS